MTGLASSRWHISSTCARAASSESASSSSRMVLAIETARTFEYPRAGRARSTVAPWGSSTPGRWVTSMRAENLMRRWSSFRSVPCVEAVPAQLLVGLDVPGPGTGDDVGGEARRRRLEVPADALVVVAHELLVERRGRRADAVLLGRPVPRGVGGEHLV